ncbi:hypothetical protein [Thermoactinomyces sp. DSM 45892]|uniref:hypothetical protein n=1 Tax=Thermoactinomyces sp. DSM 45892 TaxID=1882753 RepID=UPI000895C72E|nr:hypothetical protein [Thermoactinomyces sp. DSM 45892]SDY40283.1 hypothetical protein SAMN05444416_104160 [Thermoactinomyces sp. DSM 45892]
MKGSKYISALLVVIIGLFFISPSLVFANIDNTPINGEFKQDIAGTSTVKEKSLWDKGVDWVSNKWDSFTDWCAEKWKQITSFVSGVLDKLAKVINSMRTAIFAFVLSAVTATVVWWKRDVIGIFDSAKINANNRPYGEIKDLKTTDQQMAFLSQLVYENDLTEKRLQELLGDEWKIGPRIDSPNSLQAIAFVNQNTQEVIITYRGTQESGDFYSDAMFVLGLPTPQVGPAINFAKDIINSPKYAGYKFGATGHSLGGYLANKVATTYLIPTITFNAPGDVQNPPIQTGGRYGLHPLPERERSLTSKEKVMINQKKGAYNGLIRNIDFSGDTVANTGTKPGETVTIQGDSFFNHSISKFTGRTEDPNKNYLRDFHSNVTPIKEVQVNTPATKLFEKSNGNIVPRK